jgi:fructuronate reductase
VAKPSYDRNNLGCGLVHIGPGAFHRAHQALFTDAAIAAAGGDWKLVAIALRHDRARLELEPQDGLYTVEVLDVPASYRIVGALSQVIIAPGDPAAALAALAAPEIHVVTLTVTEAGYCLDPAGDLDLRHPDIVHDLTRPASPKTAAAWLARGLAARLAAGAGPLTVVSCDNLRHNGRRLRAAVLEFAARAHPAALGFIEREIAFPCSVVDCITPASDKLHRGRVQAALGLADAASAQREAFAQWVIEDNFAGPRPAWERVGVELTASVEGHERLKLRVLNAVHSTLAVLGLRKGQKLVREAMADPGSSGFVEAMVAEEIAPTLPDLDVAGYWRSVRARLANPRIDHALAQIAQDQAVKLRERLAPSLEANVRAGRPSPRLAEVIAFAGGEGRER